MNQKDINLIIRLYKERIYINNLFLRTLKNINKEVKKINGIRRKRNQKLFSLGILSIFGIPEPIISNMIGYMLILASNLGKKDFFQDFHSLIDKFYKIIEDEKSYYKLKSSPLE